MAKKKKGKSSDYIVYLLLLSVMLVLRLLPKTLAKWLCIKLGLLVYRIDKKHRALAVDNLKKAFIDKSDNEILDICRKVFENLGRILFDYSRIPLIDSNNYSDFFEYEGVGHLKDAQKNKKGILLLSAHLCCWEMLGAHNFICTDSASVIAKDLHNKRVNGYVKKMRGRFGGNVIATRDSVRQVMKILNGSGTVCALIDQYAHKHEAINVEFFGRSASTHYFAALIAQKLDIAVIPMFLSRVGDFKYRIKYQKPCEITRTGDRKKDLHDNTQIFTKVIEDEIRSRPEDWLWVHKRWR